jgi:uncharacterized cupredoxin-like copper-binding protein
VSAPRSAARSACLARFICALGMIGAVLAGCSKGEEDPLLAEIDRQAAAEESADAASQLADINGRPARAVSLNEWRIAVPTVLAPGPLAMVLRNTGAQAHELAVFATALELDQLPVDATGTLIEADARLRLVARSPSVEPGAQSTLDVDLPAGRYLFACNLKDHYRSGMYRYVLTV